MSEQAIAPPEELNGTVVSQQANFYYVRVGQEEIACSLRGRLKKEGETPYVGDHVSLVLEPPAPEEKLPPPREGSLALPEKEGEAPSVRRGAIERVIARRNLLRRPTIANVDQILVVMAAASPEFNPFLLDKFLVAIAQAGFEPVVVVNKCDLVPRDVLAEQVDSYRALGYNVVTTEASAEGVAPLLPWLMGKVSVLAGPSGVGKSSLLNAIQPGLSLAEGEVSTKLGRGRHTTRYAALYPIAALPGALVADTPGFSYLELEALDPAELGWHFPEMREHIPACRFPSCLHREEPDCAVKAGAPLSDARYESYMRLLDEVCAQEREAAERSKKVEAGVKQRSGRQGAESRMVKVDAADREPDRRTRKQQLRSLLTEAEGEEDADWDAGEDDRE